MKTAALACLLVCSCQGSSTPFSVFVDPPTAGDAAAGDTSCIGVVGFEVTINSGSETHQSGPLLGLAPVLDAAGCRIANPYTVEGLSLDQMLSVTVVGYDSAHVARVTGTKSAPSIGGEPLHVPLGPISGGALKPVILVIARAPLLGTTPLSDVTSMVVSTMGGGMPVEILTVTADKAGVYFSGVEPGAFGIDAPPTTDLSATFTVSQGTAPPKARLTTMMSSSGLYWQAK
jgi:hypothetical protein